MFSDIAIVCGCVLWVTADDTAAKSCCGFYPFIQARAFMTMLLMVLSGLLVGWLVGCLMPTEGNVVAYLLLINLDQFNFTGRSAKLILRSFSCFSSHSLITTDRWAPTGRANKRSLLVGGIAGYIIVVAIKLHWAHIRYN